MNYKEIGLAVCNGVYSMDNIAKAILAIETLGADQKTIKAVVDHLESLQPRKTNKVMIVDFDGCQGYGVFRLYPANDESEPDCSFCREFVYGSGDHGDYDNKQDAREAAHAEAKRVARYIGGVWATNE